MEREPIAKADRETIATFVERWERQDSLSHHERYSLEKARDYLRAGLKQSTGQEELELIRDLGAVCETLGRSRERREFRHAIRLLARAAHNESPTRTYVEIQPTQSPSLSTEVPAHKEKGQSTATCRSKPTIEKDVKVEFETGIKDLKSANGSETKQALSSSAETCEKCGKKKQPRRHLSDESADLNNF